MQEPPSEKLPTTTKRRQNIGYMMRFLLGSLLGLFVIRCALSMPAGDVDLATLPQSPPPTNQAFINTTLTKQNAIRAKYKAPALTWSSTIAQAALAKSNACKVNHAGPYGENVYWTWFEPVSTVPNFTTYTQKAFDAWVSAKEIAAYRKGDLLGGGHFTQSV